MKSTEIKVFANRADAVQEAQRVSSNPTVWEQDGGWVAVGDWCISSEGKRFRVVYGARGTSAERTFEFDWAGI